ncbi:ABC transporter permease [Actinomadura atramentaria]|uniref:ABC transporter permease n=1 Tax=Actinomadura atramentaria TaxID=1990 RepID=UPI00038112F6|nr:ABC transporter permease [Actinomadura atramentaria]
MIGRAYTWLLLGWLLLPVAVMALFAFNDTENRGNTRWQGFTLRWYQHLFDRPDLTRAFATSVVLALVSTAVATVLGTLAGLALGRYRFRGRGAVNVVVLMSVACPELVLGAALLSMFVTLNVPRGFPTLVAAHVLFSLGFVAVTVRARVAGLDPAVDEAARDLGAGPWARFRLVTLPMIAPGVAAGALLAFAMSIDDVVVTGFTGGSTVTFPVWVYGATKTGVPPQANALGTLLFAAGALAALAASRRRPRQSSEPKITEEISR